MGTAGRGGRFLGSFSLAAVEMVLSESLVGRAGCHGNRPLDDEADNVRLDALYERLPLPDYPAWVAARGAPGCPLVRRPTCVESARSQDRRSSCRTSSSLIT